MLGQKIEVVVAAVADLETQFVAVGIQRRIVEAGHGLWPPGVEAVSVAEAGGQPPGLSDH